MTTPERDIEPPRGTLARNRHHLALLILFFAWVIGQAQKTAMGVAAIPISKEFGYSAVEVGWIIGSFYGSYALLPFSVASSRIVMAPGVPSRP